jgi:hypothetical protein
VLRSPAQPLDSAARAAMEPLFHRDFSDVRVHSGPQAAASAHAVGALAYTVGRDVVFGAGLYAPGSTAGRRLLAHELTHVAQQAGGTGQVAASGTAPASVSAASGTAEREADRVAELVSGGVRVGPVAGQSAAMVHRTVAVEKPGDKIPNPGGKGVVQSNAKAIEGYLTTLCSAGGVKVDPGTGTVRITGSFCTPVPPAGGTLGPAAPPPAAGSKEPTGCGCLCDLVGSAHRWTIVVDDVNWPFTDFDSDAAANDPKSGGTGGSVTAPSPNSPKLWGAATAKGAALNVDPWLVLGHELCGHAWLGNTGGHGPDEAQKRGEGGHQLTVARENALRAEHGIDLRGTFKDPHCGESFFRDRGTPATVNWSSFRAVCQSFRADFNKRNKTNYKITDRIP